MTAGERRCGTCAISRPALSRRDFVSHATLAAIAAALAGCGGGELGADGALGPGAPPSGPPVISAPLIITLANFPTLATIGGAAKVSSQPPIALARTATGLVGYSLECTHAGTTVELRSNFTLKCPNHGAEFAFDGQWTGGEQRTSSLFAVTVTPDASGETVAITT
jgi:nitrite reductase/ring-hydroxylating ferredoxin subunit